MPAPVLSPPQERQVRAQVRKGADLPALQAFVEKKGWKVGRAKLGQLLKAERDAMAEGVPAATPARPATVEELAEVVAELQAKIVSLTARQEAFLNLPKVKLSEAANAAVHVAQSLLADPNVDARAKAQIMAQLPDLIDAARKALEAEMQGNADEELGV